MNILEVLEKARAKIDKPQKWCAYWSQSDDSHRLGVDGAVWATAGHKTEESEAAFRLLAEHSGVNDMWKPYDRVVYVSLHKAVMKMFDRAIEELKAKEEE